jgi:hypothetical protein
LAIGLWSLAIGLWFDLLKRNNCHAKEGQQLRALYFSKQLKIGCRYISARDSGRIPEETVQLFLLIGLSIVKRL